jgi:hypothetical protein
LDFVRARVAKMISPVEKRNDRLFGSFKIKYMRESIPSAPDKI